MFWKLAIGALILPTCLGWGTAQAKTSIPEQTSQQITLAAANFTATDTNLANENLNPGQLIAENYYKGCGYRRSRSRSYRRSGYYNGRSRNYYNGRGRRYHRSNYYNGGSRRYHRSNYYNGGGRRYHRHNHHY